MWNSCEYFVFSTLVDEDEQFCSRIWLVRISNPCIIFLYNYSLLFNIYEIFNECPFFYHSFYLLCSLTIWRLLFSPLFYMFIVEYWLLAMLFTISEHNQYVQQLWFISLVKPASLEKFMRYFILIFWCTLDPHLQMWWSKDMLSSSNIIAFYGCSSFL